MDGERVTTTQRIWVSNGESEGDGGGCKHGEMRMGVVVRR